MYTRAGNLILGFHGCDRTVGERIVAGEQDLLPSQNEYDWLGSGRYFWEGNCLRAFEYAKFLAEHPRRSSKPKVKDPFVIGAVLDLGRCLNLLESDALAFIKEAHAALVKIFEKANAPMPKNKNAPGDDDFRLRFLDRAVIEAAHELVKDNGQPAYDSVRGAFWEGDLLYPEAGFREQNHIQICIRNPNCIKGYFIPRDQDESFPMPG